MSLMVPYYQHLPYIIFQKSVDNFEIAQIETTKVSLH